MSDIIGDGFWSTRSRSRRSSGSALAGGGGEGRRLEAIYRPSETSLLSEPCFSVNIFAVS